ncbi:hypothetical protein BDF19DRAFT_410849 [Syncephalis fuscata]|nr:hypothetical protein BDF19DRAFT_413683 [Syncephalis fuscata]KAI9595890.1 hypothetical protein BDF19DRAFT_413350 [Syncephalis fuscata]KAI9598784.1 hypothetical protein BDF19DRAFT_410849 [Syncephalis fuscata]
MDDMKKHKFMLKVCDVVPMSNSSTEAEKIVQRVYRSVDCNVLIATLNDVIYLTSWDNNKAQSIESTPIPNTGVKPRRCDTTINAASPTTEYCHDRSIMVQRIPKNATKQEVANALKVGDDIPDVRIFALYNASTTTYGFAEYHSVAARNQAIERKTFMINDMQIFVDESTPNERRRTAAGFPADAAPEEVNDFLKRQGAARFKFVKISGNREIRSETKVFFNTEEEAKSVDGTVQLFGNRHVISWHYYYEVLCFKCRLSGHTREECRWTRSDEEITNFYKWRASQSKEVLGRRRVRVANNATTEYKALDQISSRLDRLERGQQEIKQATRAGLDDCKKEISGSKAEIQRNSEVIQQMNHRLKYIQSTNLFDLNKQI